MEQITSTTIISWLKKQVEGKRVIDRETWLDTAFKLNLLRVDEAKLLNKMRQEVSQKKQEILKNQTKKNVAAAEIEVECTDEYRFMKDQEDLLYSIDEFVRVSKKSADVNY